MSKSDFTPLRISSILITCCLILLSSTTHNSEAQDDAAVLGEFQSWVTSYLEAGPAKPPDQRGEDLAKRRRAVLRNLIQTDPQQAISFAVSSATKTKLPANVTQHLEEEVDGHGDLLLGVADIGDPVTGKLTRSSMERAVILSGKTYQAFVYGQHEMMTSKRNIPISGVLIDGMMAVRDSPIALPRPSAPRGSGTEAVNPWTMGEKKVLFIRVDFPDQEGEVVTSEQAQSLIDVDAAQFFERNSYNKTTLRATVTPLLRLPRPTSEYITTNTDEPNINCRRMLDDARSVALAAEFDTANYDLDIVASKHILSGIRGNGFVGAKGACLVGAPAVTVATTVHELGHNYGLLHANLWQAADGTTLGYGVSSAFNISVGYGDYFDEMGGSGDFNSWAKYRLNWLSDSDVTTVNRSGIYRLYAMDDPDAPGRRALRIPSINGANYWLEFRLEGNVFARNGALIRWVYDVGGPSRVIPRESNLLDMSPAGPRVWNASNAPLVVNQVFRDQASGLTIKTLRKAGGLDHPLLEIQITLSKYVVNGLVVDHSGFPVRGGASISLSGSRTARIPVGSDGVYSIALNPGGSYTLTPSSTGFSFRPRSRSLSNLREPRTLNFELLKNFTISGRIGDIESHSGVSGVLVNLSGCGRAQTLTDNEGNYSFPAAVEAGNCRITAQKADYIIRPSLIQFNDLAADQTAGFCATTRNIATNYQDELCSLTLITVSGRVTDDMDQGIAGVTVSVAGAFSNQSTTTDANGAYSLGGLPHRDSYDVRPSKSSYQFFPISFGFSGTSNDQRINFEGRRVTVNAGTTVRNPRRRVGSN